MPGVATVFGGVPESVAVPLPLSWNSAPGGSSPVSRRPGTGVPSVVKVKVLKLPAVNVAAATLVIFGTDGSAGTFTVRVKDWSASPYSLIASRSTG